MSFFRIVSMYYNFNVAVGDFLNYLYMTERMKTA